MSDSQEPLTLDIKKQKFKNDMHTYFLQSGLIKIV